MKVVMYTHVHTHVYSYYIRIRRDAVDSTTNNTIYSDEAKLLLVVDVRLFFYANIIYVHI